MRKRYIMAGAVALVLVCTAVALASGGEGHADSGKVLKDFIWRCVNFGLMAGLLAYLLAKPIKNGLAGRRESIEKALQESEAARAEAEARFAEYDAKLSRAAAEITELQESLRREGEVERERILANARAMADKIKAEAEKAAENEILRARAELRQEAARLAVAMAEELLRKNISTDDQKRLVNEYMSKVGELH